MPKSIRTVVVDKVRVTFTCPITCKKVTRTVEPVVTIDETCEVIEVPCDCVEGKHNLYISG